MKLTKKQVEHIADLSRLATDEKEKARFANELSAILDYVSQLNQADTENIAATKVAGLINKTREDRVEKFGRENDLIAMAPEHQGGCVKTKAILE